MNNFKLFIFLAVMIITANSYGQGSCLNSITLYPSDTIVQLSSNDSVAWFVYQASSPYLKLSLNSTALSDPLSPLLVQNYEVGLYTGYCNNLSKITNYDSLSHFMFLNNNLSYPNTYYIMVKYKGEWNPTLNIKNKNVQNETTECNYYCNLIANGDFNIFTSDPIEEKNPFYDQKVSCWCAAWGSPMIRNYNSSNFYRSLYLASGYVDYPGYGGYYNGSEGVYQNINVESNRIYNLNFNYKRYYANSEGELHVMITKDDFMPICLGDVDDKIHPPFRLIPNINSNVWSTSIPINLSGSQYFSENIQIPVLPPGQYKLLFYMEHLGGPNIKSSVMIDNVALIPIDPQAPVIQGHNNNCDIITNYTIANPIADFYYWSITPAISGAINSGQNTPNVTVTWSSIIDNLNPGVLTLISSQNGCITSSTINIYNCCKDPDIPALNDEIINSSNIVSGHTYYLNGEITIDNGDLELNYNHFRMGPYAKIIVKEPYKLTITAPANNVDPNLSNITAGCDFMWDGIYVSDPNAEVIVTGNSTIKDAINGIVSDNNGKFTLNNANFINNLYNVRVKNYFISSPTHSGTIRNTRFYGSTLANNPFAGEKTICGVETSWLYSFDIGDGSNISYRNEFKDMRYGIYAANSTLNIANNSFTNILNGQMLKYAEGAIYATNSLPWDNIENIPNTPFFDIYIGGNGLRRNYFEDCSTGIFSYRYNNTINNNDFKHCENGIRSLDLIDNSSYTENIIWDDFSNGVTNGFGIDLRNTFTYPSGIRCLVENNHVINKYYGISLINISGEKVYNYAYIHNNLINYTVSSSTGTNEHTGIWLQNCHYAQVKLNNIVRNMITSPSEAKYVKGIRISECKEANIFQNYMYHIGSGIYTDGLLTNTKFTCNDFNENHYGILFGSASHISNQGILYPNTGHYNPYNHWEDYNPFNSRLAEEFPLNLISPFNYYYDPNGISIYDPTIGGHPFLVQPTPNIGANYLCVSQSGGPQTEDPNINATARDIAYGQIVRDEKFYGDLEVEYRLKDREYVYEMLRSYPELINMGNIDDNLYLNFYNNIYQSDLDNVTAMKEAMYEQNLALAMEKLSQIATDSGINSNRIIASSIYLNTWANHKYELSEEQEAALTTLAYMTPYAGGDAVYTARVMLDINPDDINVDFVKGPPHSTATTKKLNVFVYPNPAQDNLNIKFNDIITNDGSIEFYGIMGNLVFTSAISKGTTEMQLNVNGINSGLYYYSIKVNNNKINSGKITIISN